MKRIIFLFLMAFQTYTFTYGQVYVLVWQEDFNEGYIDDYKWYYSLHSGAQSNCMACYKKDNLILVGDTLYMTARYETSTCQGENRYYTAGRLRSVRTFKNGYFEIKCKKHYIKGTMFSFWMFGADGEEIDIMEDRGNHPNVTNTNIHYSGSKESETHGDYRISDLTPWHVYAAQWLQGNVNFQCDYNQKYSKSHTFNSRMDITAAHSVEWDNLCTAWEPGYPDPADFPDAWPIDWIRVWKQIDVATPVEVCAYNSTRYEPSFILGGEIIMGGSECSVLLKGPSPEQQSWGCDPRYCGQYLDLIATESITLKEGFHAESGSNFKAYLIEYPSKKKNVSVDELYGHLEIGSIRIIPTESETIEEKLTSLKELVNITVYPNPNTGTFTISGLKDQDNASIEVLNMMGKVVYSRQSRSVEEVIDISGQPNGIFLLRIISGGQVTTRQIIKQ